MPNHTHKKLNDNQTIAISAIERSPNLAGLLAQLLREAFNDPELLYRHAYAQVNKGLQQLPDPDLMKIASEMVRSYKFDRQTRFSSFTIPAGVPDIRAMLAINHYFEKKRPSQLMSHAINLGTLDWCANHLPLTVQEWRDFARPRSVKICAVVDGTEDSWRNFMKAFKALEAQKLKQAHPADQIIAAALHACKFKGADLFKGVQVQVQNESNIAISRAGSGIWVGYISGEAKVCLSGILDSKSKSSGR
jgi:hypothetical protein